MNTTALAVTVAALGLSIGVVGCDRPANVAGTWTTQFVGNGGTGVYIVEMSQNGAAVAGTYHGQTADSPITPPGTFVGHFERNVLRATWMERSGAQGWLVFRFDGETRRFDGEWGNHGRPMGGSWNGTRNQ